jgi:CRISPR-associated protein Cpf1
MLFDPANLKDVVYKLNGQAEVFYRKHSLDYNDETWQKGHHYDKLKDKFKYPIISKRRYALDKFQFHVPITMNFKAIGNERINEQVNQWIKGDCGSKPAMTTESGVKHIIGIDRGERHLLYLSLIDLKGKIVKQLSLNEIVNEYNGNTYNTDYHKLLDEKEKGRQEARQSWNEIETIKELKEGYLSQVIHKIAQLIVEYKAIVVLEDLNFGFMRGRQKVEKQVYQKFEKMLIDKLNYLADKKKDATDEGGLLKAYQLTNKFESFKKEGKQNGFLFYIPAWNTSKIDPVTGFINMFDTRYENIEKTKAFFGKVKDIRYKSAHVIAGNDPQSPANEGYFEFEIDNYTQFNPKAEGTRQNWIICTNGTRIETYRNPEKNNQWDSREINLTEEFAKALGDRSKESGFDIKGYIAEQTDKTFFERLLYLFKLTVQMRNSITGTDTDYLISPVANEIEIFYDSSEIASQARNDGKEATLPIDADANGAYNIARKGLWAIEQIKKATDLKKVNLAISNKEWLNYVQKGGTND